LISRSKIRPAASVTVRLVADDALMRLLMADFLEEAGFDVLEAANAHEAVTIAKARPALQAVGTEIGMPARSTA
jgi:CheY-like chemotaxis protein